VRLEMALVDNINALFRHPKLLVLLDFQDLHNPSYYGYCRFHAAEATARCCAGMSRQGFTLLMGSCTFAIVMFQNKKPHSNETPAWLTFLKDRGFHPEWIAGLLKSCVGDMSGANDRVGTLVDVRTCVYFNVIKHFLAMDTPSGRLRGGTHLYLCLVIGNRSLEEVSAGVHPRISQILLTMRHIGSPGIIS
jgi:hypothetical protein